MIAGVVLAAGLGERFGGAKLTRELDGRPLVCHTLQYCIASTLDAVVVVVGPADDPLEAVVRSAFARESRLSFAYNRDPARGQMSSVKAGLSALPADVQAAVVCLGDMPFVGADIVNRLLEAHRRTGGFVVPECEGVWRNPRVIPAAHFADFLALGDNQ
ncbi:MAG TPA: nucleotidyltransferase family protein, partial [Candidatus Krumholzibacteria bacterium]|nr:nucleotidyltransferase family protein [Candidatus Krumholzibacteria bacterium]